MRHRPVTDATRLLERMRIAWACVAATCALLASGCGPGGSAGSGAGQALTFAGTTALDGVGADVQKPLADTQAVPDTPAGDQVGQDATADAVSSDPPAAADGLLLGDDDGDESVDAGVDGEEADPLDAESAADGQDAPDGTGAGWDGDGAAGSEVAVAPDVAVAGDTASDSWEAPPGGPPGSSCPGQDGTLTCSPDGKFRIECNNGAWTALQHCGFGVCQASLSPGGGVLTTCSVPATALTQLSQACGRYTMCFGGVAHEACVRANLQPADFAGGLAAGSVASVSQLAFAQLHDNLACAAKASTCGALAECLYVLAPKCQAAQTGCDGGVAWQCVGGQPLAVSCATLGMTCAVSGGQAVCAKAAACPVAGPVTCQGTTATQCVASQDGKNMAISADCAATGGACQAGASSLSAACSGPPLTPCQIASFAPTCGSSGSDQGKTMNCSGGAVASAPCPFGTSCAVLNAFGLLSPTCPAGQACPKATCGEGGACAMPSKCSGSEVWFCQAKQPVSFDCKAVGATCQVGAQGPACK